MRQSFPKLCPAWVRWLAAAGTAMGAAGCGPALTGSLASATPVAPPAQPAPTAVLQYQEVTAAAGVRFRHDHAASGQKYFVETMGAGVAVFDFDGDGLLDLYFPNGAPLPGYRPPTPLLPALYRNLGGLRFQDVTRGSGLETGPPMYAMGCAVGDYDADGRDDLYVTAVLGPSRLYRNEGGGRFRDVTDSAGVANAGRFGTSAAWLDYDRDGLLDLFICNYVRYRSVADDLPCFFKNNIRSYCIPFAYPAEGNRLYRNEGNGRFRDVSTAAGLDAPAGKSLGVSIVDLNDDGWPDLIVANDTTPTQLYLNQGNGTFREMAATQGIAYGVSGAAKAGMGIDVADDTRTGRISVAIGNFSTEMVGYYRAQPGGFFEERSVEVGLGAPSRQFLTFGLLFLDADNDGWKDLYLANGHVQDNVDQFYDDIAYRQRGLLYHNQGGGRYLEVGERAGPPFAQKLVARGAARADLDNDGRVDLVVTENNGPARIWRNVTEHAGNWLALQLRGVRSNRNGYGARVLVTERAGLPPQQVDHAGGGSYLSASDQRLHFGVGAARRVARVEVRWPSGEVDVLNDVEAGRLVEIREGSSPATPSGK